MSAEHEGLDPSRGPTVKQVVPRFMRTEAQDEAAKKRHVEEMARTSKLITGAEAAQVASDTE